MSTTTPTPGQRLLYALRQLAGDAPLTHRFKPAEWFAVTKELGFTDAQRNEAVTSLRTASLIRFTPESTQIIALTSDGIAKGDALFLQQQNPDVTGPMPDTLDSIRAELDYWEAHLHDGEPGSIWWEQVQARIVGLRHRENRFLTPISITNNAIGPNSRNNMNSVDQSTNRASQDNAEKPDAMKRTNEPRPRVSRLECSLEWRYLSFHLPRGAWIDDNFSPTRLQSLIVRVKNPIAPVGERGSVTPPLVAHLTLTAASRSAEIDRAYWLGRDTNEIALHPGKSGGIVVGGYDNGGWVVYANPYSESPFQGIIPEVIAPLGEKHVLPSATPIALTVSLLNNESLETLAQWQFVIHFGPGGLRVESQRTDVLPDQLRRD
jgi:hypothetical protein